jgi:transcriptional regulator with XRE-family HTH domain
MGFRRQRRPGGDLGRAIRNIRRRLDLSQTELAANLGWEKALIAKYELGDRRPGAVRLIRLLRLAEGDERGAIIKGLEEQGVLGSDLAISGMASVSPQLSQKAMADSEVSSDMAGVKP